MYYIIYQTAFIGDMILSTSMVSTIKQIDPESKVIFITSPVGEGILRNDDRLDRIVTFDKKGKDKGIAGILRKKNEIQKLIGTHDSVYISPHRFLRASILGYLIKSKIRAGFKDAALSFLYNRRIKYNFGIHEIERNHELLRSVFGDKLQDISLQSPSLFPSKDNFRKIENKLDNYLNKKDRIISIAPGSVWETKKWPAEYYRELIAMLLKNGMRIILIGGIDDRGLCDSLTSDGVLNMAGQLSILESSAAIGISALLVTNDSAPLHIASAMNIPTVAVFGPTTPYLGFGPLAAGSVVLENESLDCRPCGRHGSMKCRNRHFLCMKAIAPDRVLESILKILRQG